MEETASCRDGSQIERMVGEEVGGSGIAEPHLFQSVLKQESTSPGLRYFRSEVMSGKNEVAPTRVIVVGGGSFVIEGM